MTVADAAPPVVEQKVLSQSELFNDSTLTKRMVVENDLAVAFLAKVPLTQGHTLICPKRVVSKSADLTAQEWRDIMELKNLVCEALSRAMQVEGFTFFWSEGVAYDRTNARGDAHFHLHIVPRKKDGKNVAQQESRFLFDRQGSHSQPTNDELFDYAETLRLSIGA